MFPNRPNAKYSVREIRIKYYFKRHVLGPPSSLDSKKTGRHLAQSLNRIEQMFYTSEEVSLLRIVVAWINANNDLDCWIVGTSHNNNYEHTFSWIHSLSRCKPTLSVTMLSECVGATSRRSLQYNERSFLFAGNEMKRHIMKWRGRYHTFRSYSTGLHSFVSHFWFAKYNVREFCSVRKIAKFNTRKKFKSAIRET